jgi:hypothetical protein
MSKATCTLAQGGTCLPAEADSLWLQYQGAYLILQLFKCWNWWCGWCCAAQDVLLRLLESEGRGEDAVKVEAQKLLNAFHINVLL